ncbi:hypothetical protein F53441_13042 [Fusarium austroafricanum]|uniref:Uncharacterized protein n=1 Tax=Fusarium austroafricanum TaxID=2364996 RepID=A0A8H4JV52_9HYPO|nr:hypothetical protein F53441_13042 [Fusarium austroafricanum]
MADLIPRLQGYLTAASRDSALAQRLGNMATMLSGIRIRDGVVATRHFVCNLDAVSLTLLCVTLIAFLVPVFILFPPVPVDRSDVLRQTHSRAGLAVRAMDLRHEKSPHRRASGGNEEGKGFGGKNLCIFPVESCRGIQLERDGASSNSLEYDRLYTFAQLDSQASQRDSPVWKAISNKHFQSLGCIQVDLWVPDPNKTSRLLGKVEGAFLVLRFPWADAGLKGILQQVLAKVSHGLTATPEKEFLLPVSFPSEDEIRVRGYSFAEIDIEEKVVVALSMGVELPAELAWYIGVEHQLGIFRVDHP